MNMTMPSSATTQLESLHPKWATNTRICIVGGGASGLSAAYALVKLGYENVTVLEKNDCVAGMCETVEIEGFFYDLGGQLFAKDSAPTIMSLATEMGVEMEDMTTHKLAMINCKSKSYESLSVAKDYISIMPLTLRLQSQAEKSGRIGMHAVSDMAYDISSTYIEKAMVDEEGPCKLKRVPPSVAIGYTASGYGFVDDMPYAYMHEFTRTSMLGKIRRFKAGYASLWKSIADRLPHVQCNCEVIGIKRDGEKGTITIQTSVDTPGSSSDEKTRREYEFDKVIISGTSHFQAFSRVYRSPLCATSSNCGNVLEPWMSLSCEEEDIFSKVRTIDYYTTVLKITGLDLPQGFYYCKEYTENPSTIGHPVAMQRFHAETNVYLFWSYGNSAIQRDKISELLYEDVQAMGGKVEEVILQRKWKYFPHVCSEDMKAGFYDKLEELQGKNNTFYVGGLMAFELTERNASYSMNLIVKHFATASENVKYVKKLFELPLLVEGKPYSIEDPSELPGVEGFPDLPSLDAYLQFWARHPVIGIHTLYTWLSDDGKESDKLTYTELDNYVSTMARHILLSIKPGERVILIHPAGLQFIIAFFACVRARVLPVPLIPPDPMQRPGQVLAKIRKVAEITQSKALLTTSAYHSAVNLGVFKNSFSRKGPCTTWPNLPWIHTDAWIAKKRVDGKGLLTRVFSKKEICIPFKESRFDCSKPPLSPSSPSKLLLSTSPPQLRESDGSMEDYKQAASTASKTDPLFPEVEREFEPPKPEDICFLQFTSGSTGDPKGVMITHGGLIHNVKLMQSSYKSTSKTVLVSWLPQYHDMGLIGGLLTAMVSGGTAILFSPMAFIKRPMLWLDTISKYKATHSAAPNFAFELVIRRYEKEESSGKPPILDLSSLQFMMTSAEPIRKRTVKRFVEMLQASGLREQAIAPGYGLAENCVFVSCAWGSQQPIMTDYQGRVCCGYVDRSKEDIDICIVRQETCEEIPEGEEGEVWVSSPSSGIGYWGQPEQSMETFKNKLKSCSSTHSQRHYIKTGDLGRVIQGKLFITGRIKDLIIVQGRNVYPADIEKTVEDCCTLIRPGCCAVLGAPQDTLELMGIPSAYSSDGVGIVVIAEVRDGCVIDTEVFECIKAAVAEEHGVELACVTLIKPRSICKTTSGKIRRFECLKQFSDGKLQVVADSFFSQSCPTSPCASISTSCKQPICKSFSFNSFASSFSNASGSMSPCNLSPLSKPISLNFASLTERKSKEEIQSFLTNLVAEKTGMPPDRIFPSDSLTTYGLNSTGVVWAAQKLSDFLGINVAAIDIYTAESIFELSNTAFALLNSKACMKEVHGDALTQQGSQTRQPNHQEIEEFLVSLIAEKTGIPKGSINVMQHLASYGVNSVEVVSAAQKLSTFLGTHVAAIDIYTCSCISELVEFSESLVKRAFKDKGNTSIKNSSPSLVKSFVDPVEDLEMEILANADVKSSLRPSSTRRILITTLQMMGILYSAMILLLPAVGMSFMVTKLASISTLAGLPVAVSLLPLASIAYTMIVGAAIFLFAVPFLQPNYAQNPCLLLWTVGFVKWWTLYRLQDFATTTIACSLRGTIFMTWWYRALGAQVGKDVLLDTTDISDPALLRIGNGAILAEGACIQAHEVSQGLVRFRPLLVGGKAWMGPYSLANMGAHVPSEAILPSLQVAKMDSPYNTQKQILSHQPETAVIPPFFLACWQFLGLYLVFLVSAASATAAYPVFLWLSTRIFQLPSDSVLHVFSLKFEASHLFLPIAATLPWHIAVLTPLLASVGSLDLLFHAMVELITTGRASTLLICSVGTYITYGILLCTITCALKWCLIGKLPPREHEASLSSSLGFRLWLVHRLITSAHIKFTMFLSGTEALCMYLRSMGSKIEYMVSIRNVNPVINPDLVQLGRRCHLGDFAKIITSMPNRNYNIASSQVSIGAHSVVGAQSVVLPGATLENQVLLGAMSVAANNSTLKEGGIYVGVQNAKMINQQPSNQHSTENITHQQNLEPSYRKLVATLAAHIATTTAKVQTRYFHRLGVAGRGTMTVLGCLPKGFPPHDIFAPGKVFQVIIRHSNSLSSDDDARGDARGAAMRILASQNKEDVEDTLVDLTLKSGKAFYARTLADFMAWLMGSREQRYEHVKKYPHMGTAVWMSLRRPNSYASLRYYTNTCCLLRASDRHQKDHYIRFCLRPEDPHFNEDEGSVQPEDILPPDTGMLPRDPSDHRPPLFLADDFRKRLLSDGGVRYVLQIQLQPALHDAEKRDVALDCTRPWDETLYPFQDVALIHLNEVLDSQLQEDLRFDPMNKTHSLDMIHATSRFESASLEHGRCLAYVVAQYLRNGLPLKEEWRHMLGEIDLGKQLLQHYRPHIQMQEGGCPALSGAAVCRDDLNNHKLSASKSQIEKSRHDGSIHGENKAHRIDSCSWGHDTSNYSRITKTKDQAIQEELVQTEEKESSEFMKLALTRGMQPLLQTAVPVVFLMLAMYPCLLLLSYVGRRAGKEAMVAMIPAAYVMSGLLMSILSILSRWVLIGNTKPGGTSELWGLKSLCDTTWQAVHALLCTCFLELTKGSLFCIMYFNCLGASISMEGVYMDTLYALNPNLLEVGPGCCIGKNALLFGHLYEGGRVSFKKIELGEGSHVGTRALLLPGLKMEPGAHLEPLGLGMKDEIIGAF